MNARTSLHIIGIVEPFVGVSLDEPKTFQGIANEGAVYSSKTDQVFLTVLALVGVLNKEYLSVRAMPFDGCLLVMVLGEDGLAKHPCPRLL